MQVVFGLILVGSREAMEGEQTPLALISMAIIGIKAGGGQGRLRDKCFAFIGSTWLCLSPQVSDIDDFVAEFGEEEHEAPKPRRRSSVASARALDDGARSLRRPAVEGGSARDREAEVAAAGVEMAAPPPPMRMPPDSDDGLSTSRYPPPYTMTDRDDFTLDAQSVAVTMPPVASYDLDAPPPLPPAVPNEAVIAAVAAALMSPANQSRRLSANAAAAIAAAVAPPVYTVRAPGRRGSGTTFDDTPDSLQAPSVIARAEALIRRASQGGTSSPMSPNLQQEASTRRSSRGGAPMLSPASQQQQTLQSPSFVARMEATRRSSQGGPASDGLSFRQGGEVDGSLSRASQRA